MTLTEFLTREKLSDADFAARVGCTKSAVIKWRRRERMPRGEALTRIIDETGGAVTANDFLPPKTEAVPS